jgi:hypothetical protein
MKTFSYRNTHKPLRASDTRLNTTPDITVRLAEFQALRSEIDRRSNIQQALIALNLTISASMAGVVTTDGLDERLLIVIAFASATFGVLWLDNHLVIKEIGSYIRDELWVWSPSWECAVNKSKPNWWRPLFASAVMLSFAGVSFAAAIAVVGRFHGLLLVPWLIAVSTGMATALALFSELFLRPRHDSPLSRPDQRTCQRNH